MGLGAEIVQQRMSSAAADGDLGVGLCAAQSDYQPRGQHRIHRSGILFYNRHEKHQVRVQLFCIDVDCRVSGTLCPFSAVQLYRRLLQITCQHADPGDLQALSGFPLGSAVRACHDVYHTRGRGLSNPLPKTRIADKGGGGS
jgi:hypothetical protein